MGGPPFGAAAVPLHHGAQRGRGGDGAALELVAGTENHPLAETIEIRPGLRGQGRGGRRSGRARFEQKRNADDGRRADCHGAGFFDDAVDGMECAGGTDRARGAGAGRVGLLRRLRENHPAERRRHSAAAETHRANRAGPVRGNLPFGIAGDERVAVFRQQNRCHQQSRERPDVAVLQISASRGRSPAACWLCCWRLSGVRTR